MPGMSVKIALRGGNQESFRRWIANRNDVITANGLDQLMDNGLPPPAVSTAAHQAGAAAGSGGGSSALEVARSVVVEVGYDKTGANGTIYDRHLQVQLGII